MALAGKASFHGAGVVSNGQARAAANLERPMIAPLWAAGLSFSRCHAERNVPNDVNLRHIFSGEEHVKQPPDSIGRFLCL